MWEPRRLTTLSAFTACYRDSFTFTYILAPLKPERNSVLVSGRSITDAWVGKSNTTRKSSLLIITGTQEKICPPPRDYFRVLHASITRLLSLVLRSWSLFRSRKSFFCVLVFYSSSNSSEGYKWVCGPDDFFYATLASAYPVLEFQYRTHTESHFRILTHYDNHL
jgi:hypothetical protein